MMKSSKIKGPFKLIAALILSGLFAVLAVSAVWIEHDWGFGLVLSILGQPADDSCMFLQFLVSIMLKVFGVSMIMAGLVFGYLKAYWKGGPLWRIAGGIIPLPILCWSLLDESSLGEIILGILLLSGLLLPLFYGCMWLGENIFREIAKRTKPWRIILPGLLVFLIPLISWIVLLCSPLNFSWAENYAIDGITIFTAAFGAAFLCSRKEPSSSIVAGIITTLPFILFNCLNIGNNLLFSDVFDEGSRAMYSSILISIWCIIAICSGALSGRHFSKNRSQ